MPKFSKKVREIVTENMRKIILEKSKEIIIQDGLESMTMEKLACEAEISIGSIYNYFRNKEEICIGIMENEFMRLLNNVQEIANMKLPPVERLYKLTVFMFENFSKARRLHEIIMHHLPIPREKIKEGHRQLVNYISKIIQEGIDEKIFAPVEVYFAVSAFLGILRELQFDPGDMFKNISPKKQAKRVLEFYLSGIKYKES